MGVDIHPERSIGVGAKYVDREPHLGAVHELGEGQLRAGLQERLVGLLCQRSPGRIDGTPQKRIVAAEPYQQIVERQIQSRGRRKTEYSLASGVSGAGRQS